MAVEGQAVRAGRCPTLQSSRPRARMRSLGLLTAALDPRSNAMAIPERLREVWAFLHSEVIWLHGRWEIYNQLYGESPGRIDLLNKTAPTFFAILQGIL